MTNTTNFNFLIPDGSDNVNLLTQNFPNWTSLDAILKGIKDNGVTVATATKTGTNFAVVRNDTDCSFFRFVATANYVAGDTFTVDGVPVTATSAAGTALPSGAFVINQSVIAIVNSGVLTVLVGGGLSSVDASDVDYDNSGSGLTATDVQDAIDELKADMPVVPASYAASAITYDNTVSGLTAADVQDAIDELASKIPVYSLAGITVNAGRAVINSGGYYISNGICHVDITITSSITDTSGNYLQMINGFPSSQATGDVDLTGDFNGCKLHHSTIGDIVVLQTKLPVTGTTYHFIGSYQIR